MDQRTLLAITLSLLILLGYNALIPKPSPYSGQEKSSQVYENKQVSNIFSVKETPQENQFPPKAIPYPIHEKEETQLIENNNVTFEFSNFGGTIKSVTIKKHVYRLPITNILNISGYEDIPFTITAQTNNSITYSNIDANGLTIAKKYSVSEDGYILNAEISFENFQNMSKLDNLKFSNFIIDAENIDEKAIPQVDRTLFEYSISYGDIVFRKGNAYNFSQKEKKSTSFNVNWIGFRDRFFCAVIKPNFKTTEYHINPVNDKHLEITTSPEKISSSGSGSLKYEFLAYFGPQNLNLLKNSSNGFEKIMVFSNFSLLDAISKLILSIMNFSYKIIPNWGICIVIISIIVYFSMYPLTLKGMMSMKKMQSIQPRMAQLRTQFKNNPQKLNKEIMELYKANGVNPIGGCFPFILQMPVFIGLYQALWRDVNLKGAGFLWIKDLALPDRLFIFPSHLPVIGNEFNILPVFMAIVMFFQQKLSSKSMVVTDETQAMQQKMMLIFFPIMLGFIFYHFSSGLTLYFTLFYLFSTLTQWKMSKVKSIIK